MLLSNMWRHKWVDRCIRAYKTYVLLLTLLFALSEAAHLGCTKFYLQGTSVYDGTYLLAPSLNRYNERNTYQHESVPNQYAFYDDTEARSGWRVANTDLYCNDTAYNLEGITAVWQESTLSRDNIRFRCQEKSCTRIIITHNKKEVVPYRGVYTLSTRDPECHGRPVYSSDYYYLYYVSRGPSWRGWVIGLYSCDTDIDDFTIIAYSDSYHPGKIGNTWESYDLQGYRQVWEYDGDINVICQSDNPPEPTPISCEVWRKTAIGLCSGIAIVIVLTIAFMMYGVNCYSLTRCCYEDTNYDRTGSDDMDLAQREPLRSHENGRRSRGDNSAPTFMDMANNHHNTLTSDPDYTVSSDPDLAPPPEYDRVSNSPALPPEYDRVSDSPAPPPEYDRVSNSPASPALVDISTNNFIGMDNGNQLLPAAPPDYNTATSSNRQLSINS